MQRIHEAPSQSVFVKRACNAFTERLPGAPLQIVFTPLSLSSNGFLTAPFQSNFAFIPWGTFTKRLSGASSSRAPARFPKIEQHFKRFVERLYDGASSRSAFVARLHEASQKDTFTQRLCELFS